MWYLLHSVLMSDDIIPKRRCSICSSEYLAAVNSLLAADLTVSAIERATKNNGRTFKSETVKSHLERCLMGIRPPRIPVKALAAAANGEPGPPADFARMVQIRAIEEMSAGRLAVTTKDGLAAQALIDKREDREKGREFVLNLARLLSGGGGSAPEQLIEGDFKDVTPEENPLLAPASMRD